MSAKMKPMRGGIPEIREPNAIRGAPHGALVYHRITKKMLRKASAQNQLLTPVDLSPHQA